MSLSRARSFQNCNEADIPGYNDCPNLLFHSSSSIAPKRIVSNVVDVSGNTRVATAPPPVMKRKVSEKLRNSELSNADVRILSKDELMSELNSLVARGSKLKEKEFSYYKGKVEKNFELCLDHENTRSVLTKIFDNLNDERTVSDLSLIHI